MAAMALWFVFMQDATAQQPASGTNDLSFVVQLTSSATLAATGIVKSITLEGPSNAASFEDAFKTPQ